MEFSSVSEIYDPLQKKKVKRWLLELPGAGCQWYKQSGGCTMCGFSNSTYQYTFGGRLYPHFIFMLFFNYAYKLVRKEQPELLYIYNGGSFIHDKEIPAKTQMAILSFVAKHPTIKKVLIETRAEYVSREKLRKYKEAIGSKQIQFAFGLESADDKIRNGCLNKGISKQTFENSVKICQDMGFETWAYVYLKPHCLTEKEAIEDAIKSIEYCFEIGVTEVSLSCAFVQTKTLLHLLYLNNEFQPPRLDSIVRVIQETLDLGPVRIGHFDDTPPPIAVPSNNCKACNQMYLDAIETYRQTFDPGVFEFLKCEFCSQEQTK